MLHLYVVFFLGGGVGVGGVGADGGDFVCFFMRTSTSGVIMPAFVLGKRQSESVCG